MEQDLAYHRQRALAELDRALSADSHKVAQAHLRLSSLHLARAERLIRPDPQEPKLFAF